MIRCWIILLSALSSAAHAAQWEHSLATVASLRTGGASLVSSDSMTLDHGQIALITYWESRSEEDLDVYRCVDISDSNFEPVSQRCWRALRPTGRAPRVAEDVTSSEDLCGRPSSESALSKIAFCTFSNAFVVRTPHFELTLTPFENGGLVAVREDGRYLLVTDDELPSSVFLEVRALARAAYPELAAVSDLDELVSQPPDGLQCQPEQAAGNPFIHRVISGYQRHGVQHSCRFLNADPNRPPDARLGVGPHSFPGTRSSACGGRS